MSRKISLESDPGSYQFTSQFTWENRLKKRNWGHFQGTFGDFIVEDYARGKLFMYLRTASSSSTVALLFSMFARWLMTHTLPFTYPLLGTIRSTAGELSRALATLFRSFIPSTGQTSGSIKSEASRLNGIPLSLDPAEVLIGQVPDGLVMFECNGDVPREDSPFNVTGVFVTMEQLASSSLPFCLVMDATLTAPPRSVAAAAAEVRVVLHEERCYVVRFPLLFHAHEERPHE